MKKTQTVFVGMSGGVDSSVAALRLKKRGYNVVGVFIKVWHPEFMVCNWEEERLDAMRVAAHLEIPFLTCDAEEAYKKGVADYFIAEYAAGRTPNPDVMCNKEVKFGAFVDFAKKRGADFVATGHYVQKNSGHLHRGVDQQKDQSYFLWSLTKKQLDYAIFPVGDTTKSDIRKEALKARIPVAEKKDSQGICFLGHVDIREFLAHFIDLTPGDVLDERGRKVGKHNGALLYTFGQRHGFTLQNSSTAELPHFVVAKDTAQNTITVSSERPVEKKREISLANVMLRDEIQGTSRLHAQFRYRQKPFAVTVKRNGADYSIKTVEPQERPASGQSCVLYKESCCIGGGIIK